MLYKLTLAIVLVASLLAGYGCSSPPTSAAVKSNVEDISSIVSARHVDPETSALIIKRLSDDQEWVSNSVRSQIRFPPASTSKIPHTLIALELGIAEIDTPYHWDGVKREFSFWNQNQTLGTAYARSAVWVYQRITTQLGAKAMAEWMSKFDYGNADTGSADDLTTYWLEGPLEISTAEQIVFLEKLVKKNLPLQGETYTKAQPIFRSDEGSNWALFGKTGWRMDPNGIDLGWFVGWAENDDDIYLFAFNMDMPRPEYRSQRKAVVYDALKIVGALRAPDN